MDEPRQQIAFFKNTSQVVSLEPFLIELTTLIILSRN